MADNTGVFARLYGSGPLHLLTVVAGFALVAYVVATAGLTALWNPQVWWQSILVWFIAAIVAHDLLLFPIYAVLDRLLSRSVDRFPSRRVPLINHVRVPALGAGLALLIFLPGIIRQGAPTYSAATGQTQDPFLGRWLLLTAVMFGTSAAIYAVRLAKR